MLAVVPANAGTHTPRLLSLSAAARRLFNNEHRWLWGPACAGRRWNWSRWLVRELPQPVVPAKAGTHTPRLLSLSAAARRLSNNEHRWLWVPAFAGTTMELEQMALVRELPQPVVPANAGT